MKSNGIGTGAIHRRCHDANLRNLFRVVEGEGFEPSKAEPTDLQSAPFDRSGTPPKLSRVFWMEKVRLSIIALSFIADHVL